MTSTTLSSRVLCAALFTLLAWAANPHTTQAQLPDYLPTEGLVGWWPFNGNANDESGNGNDGVVNGATLFEDRDGNPNAAYSFDGVDDVISSGGIDEISGAQQLSVSIWFLTESMAGFDRLIGQEDDRDNVDQGFAIAFGSLETQQLRFLLRNGSNSFCFIQTDTISSGVWNHLLLVYNGLGQDDSEKCQVYLNGQGKELTYVNGPLPVTLDESDSNTPLQIGASTCNGNENVFFEGGIDDIAIYNRALTPEEVTALYAGEPVVTDCLDPEACNYEAVDEACVYPEPNLDCAGNCLNDTNNNGVCDEVECFEEVTIDVVLGESVTLSAIDPFQSSTLIWSNQMTFSGPSSITTPLLSEGVSYKLEVNGSYAIASSGFGLKDAAWYFCFYGCGCDCSSNNPAPGTFMNEEIIPIELRPTPDVYNPNHFYEYFLQGDGSSLNFSFTDGLYGDNSGLLSFSLFELSSSDFTWSNGALGSSVTITPTESMVYEVAIAGDLGQFCTGVYFVNVLTPGCTDEAACNYDIHAEVDDQTCVFAEPNLDCAGNCLNDTDGDGVCDELEIAGCTDPMACNYVAEATDDDGSCALPPALNLPESVSICEGEVTTLDAGAGYDSYLWSTGETTQTIQVSEAGTYTVEVGNAIAQGDNALPNYLPQGGLVGWWPFNGNANDESGNGNNGVVNGATLAEDRDGNTNAAYDFDGVDDRISIAHNQSFNFTQELTIALWANVEEYGPNNQWLINKGFDPGTYNWGIGSVADARFAASCVTDFNDYSSATSVSYGTSEWNFWVYQYDGAELRLMKNGDVQISIAAQGELLQNFEDVSIGYFPHNNLDVYGYFFNGKIDDIAIYNRALSEQEIQQLYTAQTLCSASATIEVIVQSLGCTDPEACNYDEMAECDDNSCTYPAEPYLDCAGNCLNDTNNNGICDELDVPGCTFEGACNYNPAATVNDNTCFFATAVYDCNGNCQQDSDGDGICDQNEGQNGSEFCGPNTLWDPVLQQCIGFDDCPSDLDGNGGIDSNDLLLFLTGFGNTCN